MFKANKNQKNFFIVAKLLLFVGVLYILYKQIEGFDSTAWSSLTIENPLSLVVATLLVYPNIWLAYLKWIVIINTMGVVTERKARIQSFFAGLVTGMLTPNMIGNFLGRLYYFDKSFRSQITVLTLFANYAQFLVSLSFGLAAVILTGRFYAYHDTNTVILLLSLGLIIAYLFYLFIDKLLQWIPRIDLTSVAEVMSGKMIFRLKLWTLSVVRFIVFTTQFLLVLHAFGAQLNSELLLAVWQVYLITMIMPSLFLGKIGIKESISLFVLTSLGINEYAVLFTSLFIWLLNSLSPAMLGLLICKNKENR